MRKQIVLLTIPLAFGNPHGTPLDAVISELNYHFTSCTSGADVESSEIRDQEVFQRDGRAVLKVALVIRSDDDEDAPETALIVQELDYDFQSQTQSVWVRDTEIQDHEVLDSK